MLTIYSPSDIPADTTRAILESNPDLSEPVPKRIYDKPLVVTIYAGIAASIVGLASMAYNHGDGVL